MADKTCMAGEDSESELCPPGWPFSRNPKPEAFILKPAYLSSYVKSIDKRRNES